MQYCRMHLDRLHLHSRDASRSGAGRTDSISRPPAASLAGVGGAAQATCIAMPADARLSASDSLNNWTHITVSGERGKGTARPAGLPGRRSSIGTQVAPQRAAAFPTLTLPQWPAPPGEAPARAETNARPPNGGGARAEAPRRGQDCPRRRRRRAHRPCAPQDRLQTGSA